MTKIFICFILIAVTASCGPTINIGGNTGSSSPTTALSSATAASVISSALSSFAASLGSSSSSSAISSVTPSSEELSSSAAASSQITATTVYVATNGSDTNLGITWDAPLRSIDKAVSNAVLFGAATVKVGWGTYSPAHGLPDITGNAIVITTNNLKLYGGYNGDFSSRSGYSLLDGGGTLQSLIYAEGVSTVTVSGFEIQGATRGGIRLNYVSNSLVSNCYLHDNQSDGNGGGISMSYGYFNVLSATTSNNTATGMGGGISSDNDYYCKFYGTFCANSAMFGGGISVYFGNNTEVHGLISNNSTINNGGGVSISSGQYTSIYASVVGNYAGSAGNGSGGGISVSGNQNYLYGDVTGNRISNSGGGGGGILISGDNNTIYGNVSNNNSLYNSSGGGVSINGNHNFISSSAKISCNSATAMGGGLYVYGFSNLIESPVDNNYTTTVGGGIYLFLGSNNTILCPITFNTAKDSGGGIYIDRSRNNDISCAITNNTSSNQNGGGAELSQSFNDTFRNCSISGNNSPYGSAIYIYRSTNTTIESSTFGVNGFSLETTGPVYYQQSVNQTVTNTSIVSNAGFCGIYLNGVNTGLVITESSIGCNSNANVSAIFEATDITGQTLSGIHFKTNQMTSLYRDASMGIIPVDASWTNINDSDYTGALLADNNTVY